MRQNQDQYIVRLPDGMREAIKRRAKSNGRSMNTEIIMMLKSAMNWAADDSASGDGDETDEGDEADELATLLIIALDDWEQQHGRINDDTDPHWSVEARKALVKWGRAL